MCGDDPPMTEAAFGAHSVLRRSMIILKPPDRVRAQKVEETLPEVVIREGELEQEDEELQTSGGEDYPTM